MKNTKGSWSSSGWRRMTDGDWEPQEENSRTENLKYKKQPFISFWNIFLKIKFMANIKILKCDLTIIICRNKYVTTIDNGWCMQTCTLANFINYMWLNKASAPGSLWYVAGIC